MTKVRCWITRVNSLLVDIFASKIDRQIVTEALKEQTGLWHSEYSTLIDYCPLKRGRENVSFYLVKQRTPEMTAVFERLSEGKKLRELLNSLSPNDKKKL